MNFTYQTLVNHAAAQTIPIRYTLHTTLQPRILGQSISLVMVPATISKSGKLRIIFYSCDSILSHSQMSTASWAATESAKLIAS